MKKNTLEASIVISLLFICLIAIVLCFYTDIQRDKQKHEIEIKAIEKGLTQKVVDDEVIWVKE